jgi:hypothetical protein
VHFPVALADELPELVEQLCDAAVVLTKLRDDEPEGLRRETLTRVINALGNVTDALETLPEDNWP